MVSVIVQRNCHILQLSYQMFNVFALLLDDTLKPATPMTNGANNQTLQRQFAPVPLSDDRLLQLVDCRELSTLTDHLLKGPRKQHNGPDLSVGCLGAICQARSTLIMQLVSVLAGLSAMSDISQGSVATHMRCGGVFSDSVTTTFLRYQQ